MTSLPCSKDNGYINVYYIYMYTFIIQKYSLPTIFTRKNNDYEKILTLLIYYTIVVNTF